jgi:hypothetical protein
MSSHIGRGEASGAMLAGEDLRVFQMLRPYIDPRRVGAWLPRPYRGIRSHVPSVNPGYGTARMIY